MMRMIGISSNLLTTPLPDTITNQRYHLSTDYIRSVVEADGLPMILPQLNKKAAKEIVQKIDGLILSGGLDVHPSTYQQRIQDESYSYSVERDQYELALLEEALKQNKPVLGICRGAQLINSAFGGNLVADIEAKLPKSKTKHIQELEPEKGTHGITICQNSILYRILKEPSLVVNSFHHQAVNQVGKGLKASSWTDDGLIESIEGTEFKFLVGVQWHPEIMSGNDLASQLLFQRFVEATK